jgi:hypothetical protein
MEIRMRFGGDDETYKMNLQYVPCNDNLVIKKGWSKFVNKYKLQIGDDCNFEMIRSTKICFTVTVTNRDAVDC